MPEVTKQRFEKVVEWKDNKEAFKSFVVASIFWMVSCVVFSVILMFYFSEWLNTILPVIGIFGFWFIMIGVSIRLMFKKNVYWRVITKEKNDTN